MVDQFPKRYPGSQPFTKEHRAVFLGREKDIDGLYKTINVGNLTILHGKSGLGKTSLLNAGVIPKFTDGTPEKAGFIALFPRFFAYDEGQHIDPLTEIKNKFLAETEGEVFLNNLGVPTSELSLWQINKTLESQLGKQAGLLLIFDQFEELFTYSDEKVKAFAREFAELIQNRMPTDFQQRLYAEISKNPNFTDTYAAQLGIIENPPMLKIVVGIRSDRLSFLDRLKPFVPAILGNTYELGPLSREQAEQAIVEPARQNGQFSSQKFTYEPGLLRQMLDFLTKDGQKPADSTQLQIICQVSESKITAEGQIVTRELVGDIEDIYKKHYDSIINSLETDNKDGVRKMIEDGLIYAPEKRRLSLFEGIIKDQYQVEEDVLTELVVKHHLLRTEPNTSGGFVYEISHDSLVEPILAAREIRAAQERKKAEKETEALMRAEAEKEREKQDQKARQRRLWTFSIISAAGLIVTSIAMFVAMKQRNNANTSLEEAKREKFRADSLVYVANSNAARAETLNLELQKTKDTMVINFYKENYFQGLESLEREEFDQAISRFKSARSIDTPVRDLPELNRRLAECYEKKRIFDAFNKLDKAADAQITQKNYKEAYVLFKEAFVYRPDDPLLISKKQSCGRELERQLKEYIDRAEGMYQKGRECYWAKKTLDDYANPIIAVLETIPAGLLERKEQLLRNCQ